MRCSNCGSELNGTEKFCGVCGTPINTNFNNGEANVNQASILSNNANFNELFIKSYIGKNADKMYAKMNNGGINGWAIFFGLLYFIYRKMYLISAVLLIVINILLNILPISSTLMWIIGFLFYPMYKWHINKKLQKIKESNPGANESQLLSIAQDKGGTSILGIIVFMIFYIAIFSIVTSILNALI